MEIKFIFVVDGKKDFFVVGNNDVVILFVFGVSV